MTEDKIIELADTVARCRCKTHGRGFDSRAAYVRAVGNALKAWGITAFRAKYDRAGNCRVCGESGRCCGWHARDGVHRSAQMERDR